MKLLNKQYLKMSIVKYGQKIVSCIYNNITKVMKNEICKFCENCTRAVKPVILI